MTDANSTMELVKFLAVLFGLTLFGSVWAINAASKRQETRDLIDRDHEGF